jgi:hypothetical protein
VPTQNRLAGSDDTEVDSIGARRRGGARRGRVGAAIAGVCSSTLRKSALREGIGKGVVIVSAQLAYLKEHEHERDAPYFDVGLPNSVTRSSSLLQLSRTSAPLSR